ncbi:DUF4046 domain-containing protein [Clostridium polynesiense]|uniref:DUF4046 domain-containing protein n=1 Tax=Clostridium polynesiense TaxID=1325933 RepID=UPI00058F0E67|nr:DUF4046 domain-containing protein [Clostridium polynesiense]
MYFKGIDLTTMDNLAIYDMVLYNRIPFFPPGFWRSMSMEEGREVSIKLLKYLIEDKLKYTMKETTKEISKEFIKNVKLWTPCKLYFGRSAVKYIMAVYPNSFRAFEFEKCRTPQGYWNSRQNRIDAIRWLIEEKLNWNINDVKKRFYREIMVEYGLGTITNYYTNGYDIINEIFPNIIKPWELELCPVSDKFWDNRENRNEAIRWLIIDKFDFSHEDVINKLKFKHFCENHLSTLICNYHNKSIVAAVLEAFKEEFMPWEFSYHRWSESDAISATIWLINKMNLEAGKTPKDITFEDFKNNKMRTLLDKFYGGSARKAINAAINTVSIYTIIRK